MRPYRRAAREPCARSVGRRFSDERFVLGVMRCWHGHDAKVSAADYYPTPTPTAPQVAYPPTVPTLTVDCYRGSAPISRQPRYAWGTGREQLANPSPRGGIRAASIGKRAYVSHRRTSR